MTTLHIRVESESTIGENLDERLAALDRGEDIEPSDPVLSIESLATLGRILRETNLELLEAIATHGPSSIRDAARLVDRGPAEVLNNVKELDEYGLLRLEQEGRSKRPIVWYDELDIDIQVPIDSADNRDAEQAKT